MSNAHFESITKFINNVHPGAADHLEDVHELKKESVYAIFQEILRYATATSELALLAGRRYFNLLSPDWVRENISDAVPQMIDMNDEWDYRRLLEALSPKYPDLVDQFAKLGTLSDNPEIVEAATDYLEE
ncbi:MAG: hypothetical protein JWP89_2813 [Schlesneria sp.]|nr:hypothetical protein [Schlesneria sp.]